MFVDPVLYDALIRGGLLTAAAMGWVLLLSRLVGLRSFSKMTAFDFIATVATGSLLATAATSTDWPGFVQPMVALLSLFIVQFTLAWSRQRSEAFRVAVDNRPHILMRDGVVDEDALRETRVARADVMAKLRLANAARIEEVRAVVLETTGDISVIQAERVDDALLEGLDSGAGRGSG